MEALLAFAAAFGLVFVAELGDRTQIVLFALATRHPRLPLLFGAAAAFLLQTLIAVLVGEAFGAFLPTRLVLAGSAGLFFVLGAFALVSALRGGDEEKDTEGPRVGARGAFAAAFLFVLLAEFADKTQITAAALTAASRAPVATFLGAFFALVVSAALALLVGRLVAARFAARTVRLVAGGAFLVAGLVLASVALV